MAYGDKKAPKGADDGADLAVVLGVSPEDEGKRPPSKPKEPMPGEGDEELPPGFESAAETFLDAGLPMAERARALKTAIHLCYDEAEG